MCGIAGIIDSSLAPETRQTRVDAMCRALAHRGPDDAGSATSGKACLGARRLAIFDPRHGHQPMTSPDGRHVLVFNGAIYNFRELRRDLAALGVTFRTDCDTEVLLAGWVRWGSDCIHRLRGMFAFAVWDSREEKLTLVRDRFGIKPLYFHRDRERLIFASELTALAAGHPERFALNPVAIRQYLGWLSVPAPQTIYRDVWSLRPGEIATFARGQLEQTAWPDPVTTQLLAARCRNREEFTLELRQQLEDSIRAHCLADVSVGAFLSGGLDSAAIVALMSRASGAQLKTFSIGFHEPEWDESALAAETARHLGTTHESRLVTGADVVAELPCMLAALDQPTGDAINTYLVSQTARASGVKVALSGLGADELFGGYPSFRQVPSIARWLPVWQWLPRRVRDTILTQLRAGPTHRRKLADILASGRNVHEICALQRRVFTANESRELLSPPVRDGLGDDALFHPDLARLTGIVRTQDAREIVSEWELQTYMRDVLLRDADVMSMRHSLELRVPFVDAPLVNWLSRQPAEFRFGGPRPKSALAAAVGDLLPPELVRREKRGFTLPFARWMRNELRPFLDETFSEASLGRSGLFSSASAQKLWRDYRESTDARQWSRVWSFAVLVDFVNRQPTTAAPAPTTSRASDVPHVSAVESKAPVRHFHKPMRRVLLLAPELFAREGGIARMLQLYLRALSELGESDDLVRFVSLNDSAAQVAAANDSAESLRSPPVEDPPADGRSPRYHGRACGGDKSLFVRSTLQLAPDCDELICGHVAQLPVAQLAKTINSRLRISLVAHGIEVWRPFTPAEKLALEQTDRVLCVSQHTCDEMRRWISLPSSRFTILPNALDPQLRVRAVEANGRAPVLLSISRLDFGDRYKGIDLLLRAMPAIRARVPGVTLRIVGRGGDLARLQELRETLGLGDAVEFLGYCTDEIVAHELSLCSVFALPSSREGFGLAFLEALAAGRPCVGVRAGAVPELLTPQTGILVPPNDVAALAHACVDALERSWDHSAIVARANEFSYAVFKQRLSSLVPAAFPPASASPQMTHP